MTLQLLDVAPIREDYHREIESLRKENYTLRQVIAEKDAQISFLESKLEEISRMTPKERNKYFKELQKQQKESKEKQVKGKETSQTATPFSTVDSQSSFALNNSNQTVTTARTLSTAGIGYEQGSSSMILSSIMIVGAALFLCISGAIAYRKKS